jgi:cysteine-rich repeat protein
VKKHETWNGDINSYYTERADIAMIHLDKKITNIDIFGIRDLPEEAIGDTGFIVGYGITYTGANDSGVHRWGNAKVLARGTLQGKPNLLEVGDPSGTCQGDSGGPFLTMQNNMLVVSGVTSFGGQTCYADRDGYDTWVVKYRTWIENTVMEFTGHGLLSGGTCGDGDDYCNTGDTKDCGAIDTKYETGTEADCNSGCTWWDTTICDPKCGDGFMLPPEVCEGGDTADCGALGQFLSGTTAPCRDDCTGYNTAYCTATICGDGVKEGNEFCDTQLTSCETLGSYSKYSFARCNSECTGFDVNDCINGAIVCGNGTIDPMEQCDDGNTVSGDGCNSKCKTEGVTAVCGNGTKEVGEACDDGNTTPGDGCEPNCTLTPVVCGNGIKETGEQCDDGNTANGDGCSAACLTEDPNAECGNGIKETGEQCDDGNLIPGDGCQPNCTLPTTGNAVCGNGTLETGEQCDDGNLIPGDGCDPDCTLPGTKPKASGSSGCSLILL